MRAIPLGSLAVCITEHDFCLIEVSRETDSFMHLNCLCAHVCPVFLNLFVSDTLYICLGIPLKATCYFRYDPSITQPERNSLTTRMFRVFNLSSPYFLPQASVAFFYHSILQYCTTLHSVPHYLSCGM